MTKIKIGDTVERIGGYEFKMKVGDTDKVIGLEVFDDPENPSLALEKFGKYWYPCNFKVVHSED